MQLILIHFLLILSTFLAFEALNSNDLRNFNFTHPPFLRELIQNGENASVAGALTKVTSPYISVYDTSFIYTVYYSSTRCSNSNSVIYFYAIALNTCFQISGKSISLKVTMSSSVVSYTYYNNQNCNPTASNTNRHNFQLSTGVCRANQGSAYFVVSKSTSTSGIIPSNLAFVTSEYYEDASCSDAMEMEGYLNGLCVSNGQRSSFKLDYPYQLNYANNNNCQGSGYTRELISTTCNSFQEYYSSYYQSFPEASYKSVQLTGGQSISPTTLPTVNPNSSPSPSAIPTVVPSALPTISFAPTLALTSTPSLSPSQSPSIRPSRRPTASPSTTLKTSKPSIAPTLTNAAYGISFFAYQDFHYLSATNFLSDPFAHFSSLSATVLSLIRPTKTSLGYYVQYVTASAVDNTTIRITYEVIVANGDVLDEDAAATKYSSITSTLLASVLTNNIFTTLLQTNAGSDAVMNNATTTYITFSNEQYLTPSTSSTSSGSDQSNTSQSSMVVIIAVVLISVVSCFLILVGYCIYAKNLNLRLNLLVLQLRYHFPFLLRWHTARAVTPNNVSTIELDAMVSSGAPPLAEVVSFEPLPSARRQWKPHRGNRNIPTASIVTPIQAVFLPHDEVDEVDDLWAAEAQRV